MHIQSPAAHQAGSAGICEAHHLHIEHAGAPKLARHKVGQCEANHQPGTKVHRRTGRPATAAAAAAAGVVGQKTDVLNEGLL